MSSQPPAKVTTEWVATAATSRSHIIQSTVASKSEHGSWPFCSTNSYHLHILLVSETFSCTFRVMLKRLKLSDLGLQDLQQVIVRQSLITMSLSLKQSGRAYSNLLILKSSENRSIGFPRINFVNCWSSLWMCRHQLSYSNGQVPRRAIAIPLMCVVL
ncbi:hypothetical protein CsSME_00046241 [Camellia sinensis var. sinensis]